MKSVERINDLEVKLKTAPPKGYDIKKDSSSSSGVSITPKVRYIGTVKRELTIASSAV